MELARLTKAACGLRWCCINPAYYFGPDSTRAFEADFVGPARSLFRQAMQAVGEADLVLHGTDPLFDPRTTRGFLEGLGPVKVFDVAR